MNEIYIPIKDEVCVLITKYKNKTVKQLVYINNATDEYVDYSLVNTNNIISTSNKIVDIAVIKTTNKHQFKQPIVCYYAETKIYICGRKRKSIRQRAKRRGNLLCL